MRKYLASIVVSLLLSISPVFAVSYIPPVGYTSSIYYHLPGSTIQGFDFDSVGNLYLSRDNQYITKFTPGEGESILYDEGTSKYGSFLTVNDGKVYFGETTSHTVKSIPVGGGLPTVEFVSDWNYDFAFNATGQAFLSAPSSPGSNSIYYWNGTTLDWIISLGGYSGPLTFDRGGNLFYGFTTMGSSEIVYFTENQIDTAIATGDTGNAELHAGDWTVYASGLNANSGLAFDDDIYKQDIFAASWQGTVTRVYDSNQWETFGTGDSPSFIRFLPGSGEFEMGSGTDGGALFVLCTDWGMGESALFKVTPIPEPASFVLCAFGLITLVSRHRRVH